MIKLLLTPEFQFEDRTDLASRIVNFIKERKYEEDFPENFEEEGYWNDSNIEDFLKERGGEFLETYWDLEDMLTDSFNKCEIKIVEE